MGARLIAAGLALAGALAAVMPASGASSPGAAPSPRLPTLTKVRALTVPYFALEFIAADVGFYAKYNLDVEFVTQTAQGAAGIPALVAGQVETGQGFGAAPIIQARAGGAKVTAVVAGIQSSYGDYRFYTLADSGIRSASDMRGKTIGVNNLGTYADIAIQVWLRDSSVALSDVRRLTVPLPSMCQALLSGQIDVVAMYSLFYTPCDQQNPGKLRLLAKDSDAIVAARTVYSLYAFSDDYIKSHPAVVRAYVAALKDATIYVRANPERAKQIIAKRTGIPVANMVVPDYPKNNCIDLVAAAQWTKLMADYTAIPRGSVPGASWVTNKFNPGCPQTVKQQLAEKKKAGQKK